MSVVKALEHASMRCGQKLDLQVRNNMTPLCSPLPSVTSPKQTCRPIRHILSLVLHLSSLSISCRIVKGRSDDIVGRLVGSRKRDVDARPSPIPQCLESSLFRQVSSDTLFRTGTDSRGIIVPGGFGLRGTEGMISAAKWAREQKVPYLGICLGFQIAVIEWARNVCGLEGKLLWPLRVSTS